MPVTGVNVEKCPENKVAIFDFAARDFTCEPATPNSEPKCMAGKQRRWSYSQQDGLAYCNIVQTTGSSSQTFGLG